MNMTENQLIPYAPSQLPADKHILVLAPHPDDEVFGCGGAIALHAQAGAEVNVLLLTAGDGAGEGEKRLQESQNASAVLGYDSLSCWHIGDRSVQYCSELIERIEQFIRQKSITLVYAPSLWENHPDHRATALCAIEAVRRIKTCVLMQYEVSAPLRPNCLIDITAVEPKKNEAMQCFISQLHYQRYDQHIEALNRYRTYTLPHNINSAEGFEYYTSDDLEVGKHAFLQSEFQRQKEAGLLDLEYRQPLVTVLIRSMDIPYLQTALNSVGMQTYPNIEIIVVNASGKEHTHLPDSIGNFQIHFIDSNVPLPRSKAANTALGHAKGEYALFLDDDDWIAAEHIEKLVNALKNDPLAVLAYTGTRVINEHGEQIALFDYHYEKEQIYVGNFIPIHSVLFQLKAYSIHQCAFDTDLSIYEDWDFWIQLAALGNFKRVECISAYYRMEHGGSSDAHSPMHNKAARLMVLKKWQNLWDADIITFLSDEVIKARNLPQLIHEKTIKDALMNEKSILMQTHNAMLHERNVLAAEVQSMLHSKSWKLTQPLRNSMRILKKLKNIKGVLLHVAKIGNITIHQSKYTYLTPVLTHETKDSLKELPYQPLISIIMPVYNVDPKWLDLAIKSIENQWYDNWELCICDDKSTNEKTIRYLQSLRNPKIKISYLDHNLNICGASNEALKLATGKYIALMDNDDELTPDALYEVVKAINEQGAEFIYSDEDKLEMDGRYSEPHFKPDFSPDMILSQNYISHLGVIKKELIDTAGGFEIGLEGAQDYDLYLKVFELTCKIVHIPKVLYHWRKIPGSTAASFSDKSYAQKAGCVALENAMKRRGIDALVCDGKYPGTYRVKYSIIGNPTVSIIIPFKDKPELLTLCIESILQKTTYPHFEIIGISNNSSDQATFDEMQRLARLDSRISFYEYNVPFNYSQINNHAVNTYAKGEHIILLNNDIEIITPEWIERLLEFSQRNDVGAVGAKLYYPDDTLQHAGVIIGLGGVAGHSHKHFSQDHPGYFFRLNIIQNLSAVTAACLMVKKSLYETVGGLNETDLKIAFNDVDFCLRLREAGYLNVYTPYCEAYHHESISRGHENTVEKQKRFQNEVHFMQERHKTILADGDPYYNPNLTLDREDFSLKAPST
ncbi:MAG: glycosyltransferase [Sulfuricurvum sp.]